MPDSFKNFERLRYRLSNDMRQIATQGAISDEKKQIPNTIFATIFSAFITEMAFKNESSKRNFVVILLQILSFCIIYIISYTLYNSLILKIIKFFKNWGHKKIDTSPEKMIQIQKDFDNIACDSIFAAQNYMDAFSSIYAVSNANSNISPHNLMTFYFYEIMHYLDTACSKTKDLVDNKKQCIKTMDIAQGVDIYRVENIILIMDDINNFIKKYINFICVNNPEEKHLRNQHDLIKNKLECIKITITE